MSWVAAGLPAGAAGALATGAGDAGDFGAFAAGPEAELAGVPCAFAAGGDQCFGAPAAGSAVGFAASFIGGFEHANGSTPTASTTAAVSSNRRDSIHARGVIV